MVVYDVNKSSYGMNPIRCFRLSKEAVKVLNLDDMVKMTEQISLVQDKISSAGLTIENLFEEVDMKIYRSNLLQAFLFDHIQPHMPAFNTNLFNLGSNQSYMTHHLYKSGEVSHQLVDEFNKIENQHKKMIQQAKKQNKKIQ